MLLKVMQELGMLLGGAQYLPASGRTHAVKGCVREQQRDVQGETDLEGKGAGAAT